MADRYFVETPIAEPQVRLVGAEAHHLAHVMRARPGSEVLLFDGSGAQWTARVEVISRSEIELTVVTREDVDRELPLRVTLGVSLPKGDRQRWLVEKSVELGVAQLVPLVCEHSNERTSSSSLERLKRAVIEASKQCGRNRLLEIAPPQKLSDFLNAGEPASVRLLAHPGGEECRDAIERLLPQGAAEVFLAIGPEGGFTAAEVAAATTANWRIVGLGPAILRVETAALALAAAVAIQITGPRGT